MSYNVGQKRARGSRVSGFELPPGMLGTMVANLRQGDLWLRVGICALTVGIIWAITGAGAPPFTYRVGYTPDRDILSKTSFSKPDKEGTNRAQAEAKEQAFRVYQLKPGVLAPIRERLKLSVAKLVKARTLEEAKKLGWDKFDAASDQISEPDEQESNKRFERFQKSLSGEGELEKFGRAIEKVLEPIEQHGLFQGDHLDGDDKGNQEEIRVHHIDQPDSRLPVKISEVRMSRVLETLREDLGTSLGSTDVADRVYGWLVSELKDVDTLRLDKEATDLSAKEAVEKVEPLLYRYNVGDLLVERGKPLEVDKIKLLRLEHEAQLQLISVSDRAVRSVSMLGMFVAVFTLCGFYAYLREPELYTRLPRLIGVLSMSAVAVILSWFLFGKLQAEIIPLLLFAMTVAVAFHQELAMMLSIVLTLIVVFLLGQPMIWLVVMAAAQSTAILLLGRIRSRRKLIYVGLIAGIVTSLTVIGVNTLRGQPLAPPLWEASFWSGVWVLGAGFLMTGALPFIESFFGVQTDISLIELGDVSHPLLQELVRRAPGTYNHSINVASIAETAAEAIGANGLLVRVGAYFHDIGKMLKPDYFVENQGKDGNRHEDLVPAMSTLIIIAHVKDGADLARQYHLPQSLIDFVEQHHGTTLVEYFFDRANQLTQDDPDQQVEENNYRYPGPKPQTREAAVLMLADAVESASRALVEPAPSRIESLVHDIAMKRLLDGQFDDCRMTLQDLHIVESSLIKSLNAVYHGRIKYPDQQTA